MAHDETIPTGRRFMNLNSGVVRQFISFGLVGVAGFLVDAGVLQAALSLGAGLYAGRIVSYLTAATATWILNRHYTFGRSSGSAFAEWGRFILSQLSGASVNLVTYALLVYFSPPVARMPVIGVAVGSIAGMLINFLAARTYAFKVRNP